ncbi:GntR family transcriptional regulator [Tessaracoccus sp. MC1865]|uniref:GntR family transcriptional regulator n=1 Tax=unclassified Tessaracoccus TaxID=2635419 RepID=UPI0016017EA4|nr:MULTISPECIES: GntR family transcriptional regulator [unclassified Tessaracoccus]MBB1484214.1 GntR family transcriptional regulator [Tessaracoccus sp. MC1865]MBB1508282.1 GntR family transcriptional regulator [Tessaracoccus sp. MC1756]QTO37233.1 GntR family transcriptional regulator [Tessaracoccus sp. MC1865]
MPSTKPYVVDITIDRDSTVPLHAQIAEPLASLIETGEIAPGTRLEDEVSMAARLRVSRPTARRAMETLTNRGLIVRRRGAGTQVTPMRVHRPMSLTSLNDDLEKSGVDPSTTVLSWLQESSTPGVAAALNLEPGAEVVYFKRLRMLRDEPLAVMQNWLPATIAPNREELEEKGFYACLRERDIKVTVGYQQIGARLATAEEGRLLNEPAGSALLTMQRTAYDEQHRAVEFGMHVYRASMYSYDQTVLA